MSEAEDEGSHVVLPQMMSSKGNYANNTSAIRLTELGPRLTLQVIFAFPSFFCVEEKLWIFFKSHFLCYKLMYGNIAV